MNITTYLKEIQKELQQTTFPNRQTVINFTSFVILFTILMSAYFAALDLGFGKLVIGFISKFAN
jgi:preprotein translocase SecE subunit